MGGSVTTAAVVLAGSVVLLVLLVGTNLHLDARARKRQVRKDRRRRPIVPDFTKVRR